MVNKYLVTGCAGFIGARVAERLVQSGDIVVGVDNLNDAYDPQLKQWRLRALEENPGFRFARLDVADRDQIERLFAGAPEELFDDSRPLTPDPSPARGEGSGEIGSEPGRPHAPPLSDVAPTLSDAPAPYAAVINLAARAGVRDSLADPWAYYRTNLTGTLNLLEMCRRHGVAKFVLASTSSLYGADNPLPYREDAPTDRPLSPYAASKKAAETLAYTYHRLHGLDVSVLRYFTVYGPAGRPDMSVFRFLRRMAEGEPITVYGDGSQQRDFTYVDDIARGTLAALRPLGYEAINLGGDRPVRLSAVIDQIAQLVGRPARVLYAPAHPADVPATWADVAKARRLLGWSPQVSLEEGLRRTAAWHRENRDLVLRIQ